MFGWITHMVVGGAAWTVGKLGLEWAVEEVRERLDDDNEEQDDEEDEE